MGFDIHGVKHKSETGEYFQNNVWGWRPLWQYVCEQSQDILTTEEQDAGETNDGYRISDEKAQLISKRLFELLENGSVRKYARERQDRLDKLPDVKCETCKATGKLQKDPCHNCNGTGQARPWDTFYGFDEENVREFAAFLRDSGGFEIW